MRLAERLTALRAWCKQCLPGRCSPDVLRPGIVRMRVYGHATTAMHDMSTPPPSNHASSKDNIHISARDPKSNTTLACFFLFLRCFRIGSASPTFDGWIKLFAVSKYKPKNAKKQTNNKNKQRKQNQNELKMKRNTKHKNKKTKQPNPRKNKKRSKNKQEWSSTRPASQPTNHRGRWGNKYDIIIAHRLGVGQHPRGLVLLHFDGLDCPRFDPGLPRRHELLGAERDATSSQRLHRLRGRGARQAPDQTRPDAGTGAGIEIRTQAQNTTANTDTKRHIRT